MAQNPCSNCGPGECYHICPNSPHYYSPEQERYDDEMSAFNRDHITEAYAATAEPSQYMEDEADLAEYYGDASQAEYFSAALVQNTLAPDMDEYRGMFANYSNDEIPF